MKAKTLSVGPIVGYTSTDSVRIFGRAQFERDENEPRKAHGILRIRKAGTQKYSTTRYFKMNPNFDMTGIAIIEGLKANTDYEYQIGWIFSGVNSSDIDLGDTLNWESAKTYEFKTASNKKTDQRKFILGSCRYALRLFGGTWFDDRGDKAFKSILKMIDDGEHIDQLIMCGDQIYADDLNALGADRTIDEYNSRYREAFTTKHLRALMSRVPTYMTLDDHEIEDNWPESASCKDWVTKFPAAIHAYSTYQASHSPLLETQNGRLVGAPTHLWYSYTDGCCDTFVTDTRTERCLDVGEREIIGPRQLQELCDWLADGSGRVKVIVSSVPLYESEAKDKWHGFIEQRDTLLMHIKEQGLKKVLFLSGDVHACMSSELVLGNGAKIVSVVSSAFFWPYPHPRRRSFKLKGQIDTESNELFTIKNASKVCPTDCFSKLTVDGKGIKVDFYSRKGSPLTSKKYVF